MNKIFFLLSLIGLPVLAQAQTDSLSVVVSGPGRTIPVGFNTELSEETRTAAVSAVTSNEIDIPESNPANALYGKVPGLIVMQGESLPWSNNPKMFIRGLATMGNSAPLILIDGYERPLSSISVEEIDKVAVLKDAAALAIYGMRGANGVVNITTKRGLQQGMKVTVSYQYGVDTPFRLPEMANGVNYAKAMNEALILDGGLPRYSASDIADIASGVNPDVLPNVDWRNETLSDKGHSNQFRVAFRGGSRIVSYYSQVTYNGWAGSVKPASMASEYSSQFEWNRLAVRTNLDINLTPTTTARLNLMGEVEQHHRPAVAVNTLFSAIYNTPATAFPIKNANGVWGGDGIRTNPVAALTARGYTDGIDRALYADLRLVQRLDMVTPGLSVEGAVGYDNRASYWEGQGRNYASEIALATRNPDGTMGTVTYTRQGADSPLSYSSEVGAALSIATVDFNARYNRTFEGLHRLSAMAGYHVEDYTRNGRNNTYKRQSIVATANYGFDNRYLLDLAMSYAGSSVLRKGDKYRFFPAVGAAWVLSSEEFMKDVQGLDLLKLRASWGKTGSDAIPYGLGVQYFGGKNSYLFGSNNSGQSGNGEGSLANANLTCETGEKFNVGVDLNFFGSLNFNVDYFRENRTGILVPATNAYSSVLGIGMANVNEGKVRNHGVDLHLNWNDRIGDVNYWLGGNFLFSRNKIIAQNEGYVPFQNAVTTGYPINQYFGLTHTGFFADAAEVAASVPHTFSKVSAGDTKYADTNGDGKIDIYDRSAMGYSTAVPEIYYGFNLGASYKGVSVSADFQGVAHYTVVKNMPSFYVALRDNNNVSNHYLVNRWTPATAATALYPRLSTLSNSNNYQASSVWMADGSYLKLRNLTVAWDLPLQWTRGIHSSGIQVYARGANLFSVDKIKNLDPEKMYATYPTLRSYYVGVKLNF